MKHSCTKTCAVASRTSLSLFPTTVLAATMLLALAVSGASLAQDAGGVCRVTTAGSNGGSGADWSSPKDLQSALGNTGCAELWIAAGVYVPTSGYDRTISFNVRSGVEVYGGFAGTEMTRAQRNPALNTVTLSGDIGVTGDQADNSIHVVYLYGRVPVKILADTILDGFTIANGNADGSTSGNSMYGGGLYCDGSYGPGSECSPTLNNLLIAYNTASGLYSSRGAGMVSFGFHGVSSPILDNVTFLDNMADIDNTGIAGGGAMFNEGSNGVSNPVLNNVTFSGNSAIGNDGASGFGGAMYNNGYAGESSPILTNVTFSGNSASGSDGHGGAMYNYGFGGKTSPQLTNVTFSGNSASGPVYGGQGGAMFSGGYQGIATVSMKNVTFSGNSVAGMDIYSKGGAIYFDGEGSDDTLSLVNTILWGNSGPHDPDIAYDSTAVSVDHSIIEAGCPAGASCNAIITVDPQLGPLADNGGLTHTMRIESDSTAFDTGSDTDCPATDQRGVVRPQLAHCDIGAVEYKLTDEDVIFKDGFELQE